MKKSIINFLTICLAVAVFTSCEKEDLSSLNETIFVRRAGADIPAYIRGNADEKIFVVVLHGGPGVGSGISFRTNEFKAGLESRYALVYTDQRGSGTSQGHFSSDLYTVEEMAKDVHALAKVLKHKYGAESKIFLLGHSWGGMLGSTAVATAESGLFHAYIEASGAHDRLWENKEGGLEQIITVASEQLANMDFKEEWQSILDEAQLIDLYADEALSKIDKLSDKSLNLLIESEVLNSDGIPKELLFPYFVQNNPLTTFFSGTISAGSLTCF